MFGIGKTIKVLGMAALALVSVAATASAASETVAYAVTGAETSIPYGWVAFCERYQDECADEETAAQDIDLTADALRAITRINLSVNKAIAPVSDNDQWGVVDQWDYPTAGKGDCEDYALLKRRMLMEAGFPREALLLTVVKDKNGEGHSILTIKTNRGDYVLDNLSNEIKLWAAAPYRFVKRQSQQNPNVWVAIGEPTAAPFYVSK